MLRSKWLLIFLGALAARVSAATVTIEPVVRSFGTERDSAPGREEPYVFAGEAAPPAVNEMGEVVFKAQSASRYSYTTGVAFGLYVYRPGEALAVIADTTMEGSGNPVPGQPGAEFLNFEPALINIAGDVVFWAKFNGPLGAGQGIYATTTTGGPLIKIIDTSDAVPGHPEVTFDNFRFSSHNPARLAVSLNDGGQVVFWGQFLPSGGTYLKTGLYGTSVSGGTPVLLADGTETVIPSGKSTGFTAIRPEIGISNAGMVVFTGTIAPGCGGVYVIPVTGQAPPTTVAFRMQAVPPDYAVALSDTYGDVEINESGTITFLATLTDNSCGMYAGDVSGGPLTAIVDTRYGIFSVPGDSEFAWFNLVAMASINESGHLGFFGRISNSATSNNQGIYAADTSGNPIELTIDAAQAAPGLSAPARLTNFQGRSAAINDQGHMAFWSKGLDDLGSSMVGLYFYDMCTEEVIRITDTSTSLADLGNTVYSTGAFGLYQRGEARSGHYRSLTNANDLAFGVQFGAFDFGFYIAHVSAGGGPLAITCPPDATLECPADTSPTNTGEATAEGCGTITIEYSDAIAGGCGDTRTITRTWTATTGSSEPASCSQIITVRDTMAPALTGVPGDLTAACDAVPPPTAPTATDACDASPVIALDESQAAGACDGAYVLTRTWTATDACGNEATASRVITVVDVAAPVLTCPSDALAMECPADTGAGALGSATANDNCSAVTIWSSDVSVPGCEGTETITRTWTAADDCGNSASCDQAIAVVDTTPPVLAGVPGDVTAQCDSVPPAATPAVLDACDADPNITFMESEVAGSCPGDYTLTRTWTATDACGNEVSAAQVVAVEDTTGPVIVCPPAAPLLECPADTSPAALGSATATDACSGATLASSDDSVPGCGGTEVITRTWTATDQCGNWDYCEQTIETVDTTPPMLIVDTTPITVIDADCSDEEVVTLPPATAEDECDGAVSVTNDAPATFPAGETTTVTYTAGDACGNHAAAQGEVAVEYGANICVRARKFTVGLGHHPGVVREPLVGIEVGAYEKTPGSCAQNELDDGCAVLWWAIPDIIANCAPVSTAVTDSAGIAYIDVPPGDYVVATHFDVDGDGVPDQYLGQKTLNVNCGEVKLERLFMITTAKGRRLGCKYTRQTGSELFIVEAEEVIWDETEQLYPFVFESEGEWGVTVAVEPPEGFVADYNELSEEVDNEVESVQFTITEVGSELVPLKTTFDVYHNRTATTIHSEVGIALTPDYARSRGFDVWELRARGLIVDQLDSEGTPQRQPTSIHPVGEIDERTQKESLPEIR